MPSNTRNTARDDLHDALETLVQTIPVSDFPTVENWQIGYGPDLRRYSRSPYWNPMDTADFPPEGENRTTVIRLLYTPTGGTVCSGWIDHTNYVSVRFGRDWDPEYNRDDDYDTVLPSSEAGPDESTRVTEKYMIGGPLCEPVVTGNVETAAEAVLDQLPRVEAGTRLNHIFEALSANRTYRLTADDYRESLPDAEELPADLFDEDIDTASPLQTVSGIGDKTVKRFGSRFAVYTNLRTGERDDLSGLLPGWSHSPDLDEMDDIITALAEHYQDLSERPDWPGPVIEPSRFTEYPMGNPRYDGEI